MDVDRVDLVKVVVVVRWFGGCWCCDIYFYMVVVAVERSGCYGGDGRCCGFS